VTITNVLAPKLVIPKIKSSSGERMMLRDFGVPPFQVVIPIGMIKPHIDLDSIGITNVADCTNIQTNMINTSATNNQASMSTTNNQANMSTANNQANMSATNNQASMNATNNQANMNTTNNQANMSATNNQDNQNAEEFSRGNEYKYDSIQEEESNQSNEDEDVSNLTSNDIVTELATMVAGTTNSMTCAVASMLNEAPTTIENRFSSVVDDSFHFMDRPKVPMHHDGKRGILLP
jgi:hypothetical protein